MHQRSLGLKFIAILTRPWNLNSLCKDSNLRLVYFIIRYSVCNFFLCIGLGDWLKQLNQSASMLYIFYLEPESISTCIDLWARQFYTVNIIPKVHSLVKIPYLMRFTRCIWYHEPISTCLWFNESIPNITSYYRWHIYIVLNIILHVTEYKTGCNVKRN